MKYLLFDAEGVLTARYDSDITIGIPDDSVEVGDALFVQTIQEKDGIWKMIDGVITKTPLVITEESFESKVKKYEAAVEAYLNAGAQAAGFDNIDRARIPAGYPNPKQALSITFGNWHTAVWDHCQQTLSAVQGGAEIPPLATFISSLPLREQA